MGNVFRCASCTEPLAENEHSLCAACKKAQAELEASGEFGRNVNAHRSYPITDARTYAGTKHGSERVDSDYHGEPNK